MGSRYTAPAPGGNDVDSYADRVLEIATNGGDAPGPFQKIVDGDASHAIQGLPTSVFDEVKPAHDRDGRADRLPEEHHRVGTVVVGGVPQDLAGLVGLL